MNRSFASLTALLLISLLLSSCNPPDTFHAGRPITKEELASLSAELFTAEDEPEIDGAGANAANDATESVKNPDDTSHDTVEEATVPGLNQTVYWLKDGKVYHADPDCQHLEGQLYVKKSTRRTAEINGLRPCKDCANH